MVEALLGVLLVAVVGVFWLSTQPWFDLLPRGATRGFSMAAALLLLVTAYAAPSVLQEAFQTTVERRAADAQRIFQRLMEPIIEDLVPEPSPTPS